MNATSILAVCTLVVGVEDSADVSQLRAPRSPSRIAGGVADAEFDGTVRVAAGADGCTGIMVSHDVLLTAGHCLDELDFDSGVAVFRGPDIDGATVLQGQRWAAHPDLCTECDGVFNDLGYIQLLEGFSPSDGFAVPVADVAEWDFLMRSGTAVTLVGYGRSGDVPDAGTRRRVETRLGDLIAGGVEFTAGGDGKGGCAGDSGGPAFASLGDGTRRLVGLTSRGYGCGETGIYTAPYPGLCWLRDETGVDLLPADCADCNCIDLSTSGCACRTEPRTSAWYSAFVCLGLIALRRRRRRA